MKENLKMKKDMEKEKIILVLEDFHFFLKDIII